MKKQKALEVLRHHERWRTGEEIPQTDVNELTEALQVAIDLLEQDLNYCQCETPDAYTHFGFHHCKTCHKTIKA